jgi:hypothetical protein
MLKTVCLITSRLTEEARRERFSSLLDELRAAHPGAAVVTVDDSPYPCDGGDAWSVPGADAAFVRDGVRLSVDDLPDKFRGCVSALQLRHVANARKHMDALRAVAAGGGVGLVLEDDALPCGGWREALAAAAAAAAAEDALAPGGCLAYLGVPAQNPPGDGPGPFPLSASYEFSPVCDSYVVGPQAARCLAGGFLPVRFRTNVHLGYLAESLGARALVFRKNAFFDGSKLGAYASTLNVNNRLVFNWEYMRARKLLEAAQGSASAEERAAAAGAAKEILAASSIKGNSDVMYLRALCEAELSGPRAGKVAFAAAYEAAVRAGALINNESELLTSYVALHGDLDGQGVRGEGGAAAGSAGGAGDFSPAFSDPLRVRDRPLRRLGPAASSVEAAAATAAAAEAAKAQ